MSMNVWNLRSNKARLEILERTEAQRKHRINILSVKTKLDSRNNNALRTRTPHIKPLHPNRKQLQLDNESMVKRIVHISKSHSTLNDSLDAHSLSRKLKTYSSLNRTLRLKEIEDENTKMFSRLVTAAPTIRRAEWVRGNLQAMKYKENLLRGKCTLPST